MSHIVSLRSASLRALRSSSTVADASKYTTYSNRSCQQQYSYSTLPSSSNRILIKENNKSKNRVSIPLMSLLACNIKTQYSSFHINLFV
jgi:hypothetical protein